MKKYFAELLGTLLLSLVVVVSSNSSFGIPTPIFAGLVLLLLVYVFGAISGAHLNPVITLGLLSMGNISRRDAVAYIVFQICGGILAGYLGRFLTASVTKQTAAVSALKLGIAEAIGTFILALGIAAVVRHKVGSGTDGLVIGTALAIGAFVAGAVSGGFVNPAVALAANSLNLMYIIGPLAGALAGFWIFKKLDS